MIPKILRLFLCISWLQAVYGVAYSKIYVQSGADVVPIEYVRYGAPRVVTNAQIAELSAPPIGSALPLPNVLTPCVAPCILPAQTVQAVPSNAKIISYNAPSVPAVVVPSNDDKSSYEYSYVVYDENTGDRKAQRELSDGSLVQGEYSFVQPDGYIREVKYTADDLTGFNAVVKNFLPESVVDTDKKSTEIKVKSDPPPCKETKSAAIKVEKEQLEPSHGEANEPISESPQTEPDSKLKVLPVSQEPVTTQTPLEADIYVAPAEHRLDPSKAENKPEYDSKTYSEHFLIQITESPEEHAKHDEHPPKFALVHKNQLPGQLNIKDAPQNQDENSTVPSSVVELIETPNKKDYSELTHESVQALTPEAPTPQVLSLNGISAYNDILKCVQAAIANRNGNAPISPLTYIILPAGNKPC